MLAGGRESFRSSRALPCNDAAQAWSLMKPRITLVTLGVDDLQRAVPSTETGLALSPRGSWVPRSRMALSRFSTWNQA